jgi:hypothetical protein
MAAVEAVSLLFVRREGLCEVKPALIPLFLEEEALAIETELATPRTIFKMGWGKGAQASIK